MTSLQTRTFLTVAALATSLFFVPGSSAEAQNQDNFRAVDVAPLDLDLPDDGQVANTISLPPPFNDYYLVINDLGPDFITDGEILGSFALALASQGHFYSAWQFSEQVEPTIARAEVRLDLTAFLVTAGNRALARDALESAAYLLLDFIPQQEGLDRISSRYIERYPQLLERLIAQETSFFGRESVLRRIATVQDPTAFALAITYYINQFGLGNISFRGKDRRIPGALLDIVYNTLQSLEDRERYLDNLLVLSRFVVESTESDARSLIKPETLIDEILAILARHPELMNEQRQEELIALLAMGDRLSAATELIVELGNPELRARAMIRVAEELASGTRRNNARDLFNLSIQLAKNSVGGTKGEDIIVSAIRAMTRKNLWASAYSVIVEDDDPKRRPARAAAMARELLLGDQTKEVDKLWIYITPPNLKSSLYLLAAELAFADQDTELGYTYISNIFLETNFAGDEDGYDPEIITRTLELSLRNGSIDQINRDFKRAYDALNFTKDPVKRLYIETLVLQLYAQRSEVKSNEAFERARQIILNIWRYRESPHYPVTVVALIRLLALGGKTTLAITQASAMWENPARPETSLAKQQALAYALEEALKQNKIDVARKSLIAINDPDIARRALVILLRSIAGLSTSQTLLQ